MIFKDRDDFELSFCGAVFVQSRLLNADMMFSGTALA